MIRQFLNPPNWFSSASLFCGLYSIILAGSAQGDASTFYQAGLMIFFAGLFDALDGRVARLTGTGSAFGVQLDSLIDIISFGLAPAVLVYHWALAPYGAVGVAVAGWFMLCGAFRLARFNIQADGRAHAYSQGLTITMAGGTLAAMVMFSAGLLGHSVPVRPQAVVLFTVALAVLMVSSVPYRTMKTLRRNAASFAGVVAFAAAFIALGAVYDISTVLITLGSVYAVSGPLEAVVTLPKRRRARTRDARQPVRRDDER
jgi:CDP-diacylglycerol--serine O-phosphatidyltransferase